MSSVSADPNRRGSSRSNVLLKATLQSPGGSYEVVLRNLSEEGALVQGDKLPVAASRVLFHRQGLSVPGRVAWSHCGCAGIEFDVPLFPNELLRHVPRPSHKLPPLSKGRPGFANRPLTESERSLIKAWAIRPSPGAGD